MDKILVTSIDEFIEIAKALSTEVRVEIFKRIQKKPLNVHQIAEIFHLPLSTAAANIKKLEDAKLIQTIITPGNRGSQKVCSSLYDRILVDLNNTGETEESNVQYVEMPIGQYVDCQVKPTCGLVSENKIIGFSDDPRTFFDPEHVEAQLLWFGHGYVEYRFPNKVPYGAKLKAIELSVELCSEAPMYNLDWPSDITVYINNKEIGTWMCPSDFGGERGLLTPMWWKTHNTQHGVLKRWRVTSEGSFIDGLHVSPLTIDKLDIGEVASFPVRIGVKEDAINQRGVNLFGKKFGNYEQDIILKFEYEN